MLPTAPKRTQLVKFGGILETVSTKKLLIVYSTEKGPITQPPFTNMVETIRELSQNTAKQNTFEWAFLRTVLV